MSAWYIYVIYESGEGKPSHVKVGITNNPQQRLKDLQGGNPRPLRAIPFERKPSGPFGIPLPSEEAAREVEDAVHNHLRLLGCGLMGDFDHEGETASHREWFSGIEPEQVWKVVERAVLAQRGLI